MFNRARRLKTAPSSRPELDDANLSYPFNYSAGSGRKCNDDGDLWDYSRLDDIYIYFLSRKKGSRVNLLSFPFIRGADFHRNA